MAKILDGTNALAKEIRAAVKQDVSYLKKRGIGTGLAIMLVGKGPAAKQ